MWHVWRALCAQHRYEENSYERYTTHIGPQLLSACLLKVREQLSICPSIEEFRQGYIAPYVPIDDILVRIRNGQDFRDYDVLENWFPRPKPKTQQQQGAGQNRNNYDRNGRRPNLPPPPTGRDNDRPYVANPNHYPQLKTFCDRFKAQHQRSPRVSQLCNAAGIPQSGLIGPNMLQNTDCKRFHVAGSCNCGGRHTHGTMAIPKLAAIYAKLQGGLERLLANPDNYREHRHGAPNPAT